MKILLKNAEVNQHIREGNIAVEVSVDALTAFKSVGVILGLHYPQADERNMRVQLAGLPEMPALELQEDISLHGSPCWDTVRVLETNPQRIEEYLKFQEALDIVRKRCAMDSAV